MSKKWLPPLILLLLAIDIALFCETRFIRDGFNLNSQADFWIVTRYFRFLALYYGMQSARSMVQDSSFVWR